VVSGGSNIAKVVTWLDSVAKSDLDAAIRMCAVQSRKVPDANDDLRQLERSDQQLCLLEALRRVSFLLSHREEATREHGIALVVNYLTLYVLAGHFSQEALSQLASPLDAKGLARDSAEMLVALEALEKLSARSYEKAMAAVNQAVSRVSSELTAILAEAPTTPVAAAVVMKEDSTAVLVDEPQSSEADSSDDLVASDGAQTEPEIAQQAPTTPMVDNSSAEPAETLQSLAAEESDGTGEVAPLKIEF
jgi:hypothetical protein